MISKLNGINFGIGGEAVKLIHKGFTGEAKGANGTQTFAQVPRGYADIIRSKVIEAAKPLPAGATVEFLKQPGQKMQGTFRQAGKILKTGEEGSDSTLFMISFLKDCQAVKV